MAEIAGGDGGMVVASVVEPVGRSTAAKAAEWALEGWAEEVALVEAPLGLAGALGLVGWLPWASAPGDGGGGGEAGGRGGGDGGHSGWEGVQEAVSMEGGWR